MAVLRPLLALVFLASLWPLGASFLRKVGSFEEPDVLVARETEGSRILRVGPSALPSGLMPGDLVVLVDGLPAARDASFPALLSRRPVDLHLVREGRVSSLTTRPIPSPWDVRYLFLAAVGAAFLVAGTASLRAAAPAAASAPERVLFAGLCLSLASVLAVTPAPPFDGLYRTTVLVEEAGRALFPAFLLALLFTFPRRARGVHAGLFFLPAAALVGLAAWVYGLFGGAGSGDATGRVVLLDRLQQAWIASAALAGTARLVLLARRRIDLLTEKQVRYLLLGTAAGILPAGVFALVPSFFGTTIPVVSTLSLLPLAIAPLAFLAALTKWRLWDVEVFARESAALLSTCFFGAFLFAGVQRLAAHPLPASIPHLRGTLQAAAGIVIALGFVPVRRTLSGAFLRLQYGDALADRAALAALARDLLSPRRPDEISRLLCERVSKAFGGAAAALLPVDGEVVTATGVDGGPPIPLAELPAGAVDGSVRLSRESISVLPTAGVARLRRRGFRTLAPLAISGRLLALFAVGDKARGTPLSAEDRELVESVLAPAALALDHARLYEELAHEARRYRTLKEFHEDVVAGSAAAIASTDASGAVTSANAAFANLVGLPRESLEGLQVAGLLPAKVVSALGSWRGSVTVGDHERVLDVAVSPFPGAPEGSSARVFVLHDVTETARLEKALADRERLTALSALSAGMAHEVNTPLTGVASFARLVLDETPASDPRRPLLEKIEQQAFRASRLVSSLLDLARGRPRDLLPVSPASLLLEAARSVTDEAASRGVVLTAEAVEGLPSVAGHSDALVQVLHNLARNGVEAAAARTSRPAGEKGHVVLSGRVEEGRVVLSVEDDGAGLSPEEADRIFEPFYTTRRNQGGVGLGLAVAGDIIRAHGGTVTVDSAPGRGARFLVSLPALT